MSTAPVSATTRTPMGALLCRFCAAPLRHLLCDLGMSPLSNAYVRPEALQQMEPFYPLTVYVCERCFLVQLPAYEKPENIFSDYAYFSSFSDSWLEHVRRYAAMMIERFGFGGHSLVVELASNDGYLLQYFAAAGVPVLGIEPAANVAQVAKEKGIPTLVQFFGAETARQLVGDGRQADLLLGNNVLAHVPDINDFVEGMRIALARGGTITMEFPHLMRLIEGNQFDTIYHEHFSYLSLHAVETVFAAHGLQLFDVEELPTHGGSLRIYAQHAGGPPAPSRRLETLRESERIFGIDRIETYLRFAERVQQSKRRLLAFLLQARDDGKRVVGYGAPAKGNTLLNYCGIRTDLVDYTVDRSPYKQGLFLPGTRIPIHGPEKVRETRPDYLLILPWNLRDEIVGQMAHIREWGGRFVVPIPTVEVLD
jgi:SAM-dependent methyltransferase